MVFFWHLLDFWGELLPIRTCTIGTCWCLFPWAIAIFSPGMHRHLRICCSGHRNTDYYHLYAATEDVAVNTPDAVGMSSSSDGTESVIAPQSSPLDTEPHCCMLHTSGASCACSGIANSEMVPHWSMSVSGLSCIVHSAGSTADAGCGYASTFVHSSICKTGDGCCFQLRFCHRSGSRAFDFECTLSRCMSVVDAWEFAPGCFPFRSSDHLYLKPLLDHTSLVSYRSSFDHKTCAQSQKDCGSMLLACASH